VIGYVILAALVGMYLHFMNWLMKFHDLDNQLTVQKEIVRHNSEMVQDKVRAVTKQLEELRTELNGINLKLGLKLK
jgi:hypothetical protein